MTAHERVARPEGVSPATRKARALIGWLTPDEGALWLAGLVRSAALNPEYMHRCEAARVAVSKRSTGVDQSNALSDLHPSVAGHVDALREHPAGSEMFSASGEPRLVDLRKLCAIQPQVHVEDAKRRVGGVSATDHADIAAIALPLPTRSTAQCAFDATRNAWIFSSGNPNLRVVSSFSAEVQPGSMGFGFVVSAAQSYIAVAKVGNRLFLRDGYHRAYGFLASGITHVPAMVKEFASLAELHLPPGLLPPTVFLGDRPPTLCDYMDDEVAAETEVPVLRKVVVVQALEVTAPS